MEYIDHSFFDTLYIDPKEGVYWDSTCLIGKVKTQVGMLIENPAEVNLVALEKAAKTIKNLSSIIEKTKQKLSERYLADPAGPCWEYFLKATQNITPVQASEIFKNPLSPSPQNLFMALCPALVAVYPTNDEHMLIIDFDLGKMFNKYSLSICLDSFIQITHISVEKN